MLKEYIDSFINDISEVLKEKGVSINAVSVLRSADLEGDSAFHTGEFPKVIVMCDPGYVNDYDIKDYTIVEEGTEIKKRIDYETGLLVKPVFNAYIICDDPEQNAILEDIICEAYSSERKLYITTEKKDTVVIPVKKNANEKIVRNTNTAFGLQDYSSNICISAVREGFSENINYHPSKIAFNPYLRFDALEKYIAYNDLIEDMFYKVPFNSIEKNSIQDNCDSKDNLGSMLMSAITGSNIKSVEHADDKDSKLTEDEIKIESDYKIINKMARLILEKTELLDKNHDDPFIAKKILQIMIIDKTDDINKAQNAYDSFSYKYDQEKESFYSNLKAKHDDHINLVKKKINSEKKRNMNNKAFSARGDKEENRYIDAVIQNIKSRFQYNIEIYGGSTYMEFYRKKRDNELIYPCVLIKSKSKLNISFDVDNTTFKLLSNDNGIRDYVYDFINYLPYTFEIEMQIYNEGGDNSVIENLKNYILNMYTQGADIFVKTPNSDDTYSMINLKCNMAYSRLNNDTVCFNIFNTVYYAADYDKNALDYDSKLQLAILQRIAFYRDAVSKINNAVSDMNTKYISCFDGKPLGAFDFLNGAGYKELKRLYNARQYISKDVFDKGLKSITSIYPVLYNCFMQGMPIQQIIENMNVKKRQIAELINLLIDDLNLPDGKTGTYTDLNFRKSNILLHDLINRMQESENILLSDVIEAYIEEKENSARERYEMEQYYAEHPDEEPQAGSGILSSMLRQTVQKSNIQRNAGDMGKRDLIGQAGCAQINGGSCSSCNIRRACSRYFF